jgi:acyl-CoA synthetase (AMP-forming)/AMP-acid ligase II
VTAVERVSAADAERRQRQVAGALAGRGLAEGDRLGVVAPSSVEVLVVVLAALRRGIVPVILNPALLPAEQDALLADAEPALVLRDDEVAALAAAAEEAGTDADLAAVPLARPMHYTSGTTGTPKGVWSGVLDEAAATALMAEERELWGFEANDVHLVCSPLHHSAPVRFAAGTLLAGGDVVLLSRFDAGEAAAAVTEHWPTTAFIAPAHLQRLRAVGEGRLPELSSLRLLAHAGAPCPEPLKRWALDVFPEDTVWEFYGSTEGQFTACPPADWLERPGTVGKARPGRNLSVDDEGVIWCDVPDHARFEYWRDPAKTADAWRGCAFTVFDLGRLDGDGFLFLDARRDDLVISGGVNVYPAEVERALTTMSGIGDVAVFGIADERWGQRVCAAVTGTVDPDAVIAFARERLAPYKCPKQVVRVTEIPHTPTGKLRRSTLAEDLGLI